MYKLLLRPTNLADLVSIGASGPAVESTLGGVPAPFACDLLCRSFIFVMPCFLSLKLGVLVLYSNPDVAHFSLSAKGVGRYSCFEDY